MLVFNNGTDWGGIRVGVLLPPFSYAHTLQGYPGTFGIANIVESVLGMAVVVEDGVDPRKFFGTTGSYKNPSFYRNRGNIPFEKPYNGIEDVNKYSTSIGTTLMSLSYVRPSLPSGEGQVSHISIDGNVIPRVDDLYTFDLDKKWVRWGLEIPIADATLYDVISPCYGTSDHSFPNFHGRNFVLNDYVSLFARDLASVLEQLDNLEYKTSVCEWLERDFPSSGSILGLQQTKTHGFCQPGYINAVTKVRKLSDNRLSWTSIQGSPGAIRAIDVDLSITPIPISSNAAPNNLGRNIFDIAYSYSITERWYEAYGDTHVNGSPYYGWKPLKWLGQSEITHSHTDYLSSVRCIPWSKVSDSMTVIPDLARENKSSHVSFTESLVRDNLFLFRPSVMFSYADAMSHFRVMASNYIEVIAEADELLRLMPDLSSLLKAWYSLKGNIGPKAGIKGFVKAGMHLGDFFSSVYLLASFGWRPVGSNAAEISNKIDLVGTALRQLQSPGTYHGKFERTVDALGIQDIQLTARTKIRVRGASDDFVLNTLRLDSLGLLPRSSNLWDLVPWSWFADYFTGLSGRYDIIDSVLLGFMLGVDYSVHSYSLEFKVDEEVLRMNNLQAVGDDPIWKYYAREVSLCVPMIFESKIDFGAPIFPPDKGILAALLWQLMRR